MTFVQLQDAVMDRLNLQSSDARTRVKAYLNQRYRQVQSGVSLARTRRAGGTVATVSGVATAIVSGVAKILGLFDGDVRHQVLEETTRAEILRLAAASSEVGTPRMWAVDEHLNDVVIARFYPTPNSVLTLDMDCLADGTDMSQDDDEPTIPADFHDILIDGAIADEYLKLDNQRGSMMMEARFEKRLTELRYFLVKTAYLRGSVRPAGSVSGPGSRVWNFTNGF